MPSAEVKGVEMGERGAAADGGAARPADFAAAFASLGFGAAQFGNLGKAVSEDDCAQAVDHAWRHGVRYFDTAPHYGLGLSERRLGRCLAARARDEFVLSTKVGRLLRENPEPTGSDEQNGFHVSDDLMRVRDYTADGVRRSIEESLQRLGLDRIDIVWIHDPEDPSDRFDEAWHGAVPALESLREEGVIRAWGVGSKDPTTLRRFVDHTAPDLLMVAGRHTLIEQQPELLDACQRQHVGVVAVGVFNSGLLARNRPRDDAWYEYGPAPEHLIIRARRIADIAERHGVTLPGAALAYPRRHPAVVNVMAGMRSADQVRRNVSLHECSIPGGFWKELHAEGLSEG